jgi:hypothetical protein
MCDPVFRKMRTDLWIELKSVHNYMIYSYLREACSALPLRLRKMKLESDRANLISLSDVAGWTDLGRLSPAKPRQPGDGINQNVPERKLARLCSIEHRRASGLGQI